MAKRKIQTEITSESKCNHEKEHPGMSHKKHVKLMKGKQVQREDTSNVVEFIKNMTVKNYAVANKYLQATLDAKMKERIRDNIKSA